MIPRIHLWYIYYLHILYIFINIQYVRKLRCKLNILYIHFSPSVPFHESAAWWVPNPYETLATHDSQMWHSETHEKLMDLTSRLSPALFIHKTCFIRKSPLSVPWWILMNDQSLWKAWKHESHLKARTLRQMELPSWIQSLSNLAIKPVKPHQTYRSIARIHEFITRVMGVSVYQILSLCLQTLTAYDFETEAITRLRNAVTWPQQTPANAPAAGAFPTLINIQSFMIYHILWIEYSVRTSWSLVSEGKTRKKSAKVTNSAALAATNYDWQQPKTLRFGPSDTAWRTWTSKASQASSDPVPCVQNANHPSNSVWDGENAGINWGVLDAGEFWVPSCPSFVSFRSCGSFGSPSPWSSNRRIVDATHMFQSNPMDTIAWNTLPGSPWTSAPKAETDASYISAGSRSMVTDRWILIHSDSYSQLDANFTENCATKLMRLSNLGCFSPSRLFGVYSWGALRSHCQWHFILLHWSCQRRSHESRGREVVYLRLIIKRSAW